MFDTLDCAPVRIPCAEVSWKQAMHHPFSRADIIATIKQNLKFDPCVGDEGLDNLDLTIDLEQEITANPTLEQLLDDLYTRIEPLKAPFQTLCIRLKFQGELYLDCPIFLINVHIALRLAAMKQKCFVFMAPRFWGVPGTRMSLHHQMLSRIPPNNSTMTLNQLHMFFRDEMLPLIPHPVP